MPALVKAAEKGHVDVCALLADRGANLDIVEKVRVQHS